MLFKRFTRKAINILELPAVLAKRRLSTQKYANRSMQRLPLLEECLPNELRRQELFARVLCRQNLYYEPSPLRLVDLMQAHRDLDESLRFVCSQLPIRFDHLFKHVLTLAECNTRDEVIVKNAQMRLLEKYTEQFHQVEDLLSCCAKSLPTNEQCKAVLADIAKSCQNNEELILEMFDKKADKASYFIDRCLIGDLAYRTLVERYCEAYDRQHHSTHDESLVNVERIIQSVFDPICTETNKRLKIQPKPISSSNKNRNDTVRVDHLESYLKRVITYAVLGMCHNATSGTVVEYRIIVNKKSTHLVIELWNRDFKGNLSSDYYSYKSYPCDQSLSPFRRTANAFPVCMAYLRYFGGKLHLRLIPGKEVKLILNIPLASSNVFETIPIYNKCAARHYENPILREIYHHQKLDMLNCCI